MTSQRKYRILHNIGDIQDENYTSRDKIISCNDILTFDGVYKNVYENRDVLAGKDVILFITGNYIGKDNSFDKGKPLEQFCTLKELDELFAMGCKIGWHTWSHRNLIELSDEEIDHEIKSMFPCDYFAYPFGGFNKKIVDKLINVGYRKAFSVNDGDNSDFQITREYL